MKAINRFFLFLAHLGTTIGVQFCLYRMILRSTENSSGPHFGLVLLAIVICIADFALSMIILKNQDLRRCSALILQFWDLLLASPLFLVGIVSLFSGKNGTAFGVTVLLIDLLLIVERSTSYVLRDSGRNNADKSI